MEISENMNYRPFASFGAACGAAVLRRPAIRVNLTVTAQGDLTGDLVIKREGFSLYFPLMSGLLASLVLTLLLWLFRK
jgi:hypothetical protein